jgi:hypothetical protein
MPKRDNKSFLSFAHIQITAERKKNQLRFDKHSKRFRMPFKHIFDFTILTTLILSQSLTERAIDSFETRVYLLLCVTASKVCLKRQSKGNHIWRIATLTVKIKSGKHLKWRYKKSNSST